MQPIGSPWGGIECHYVPSVRPRCLMSGIVCIPRNPPRPHPAELMTLENAISGRTPTQVAWQTDVARQNTVRGHVLCRGLRPAMAGTL